MNIYTTKGIQERLDLRILTAITSIIKRLGEDSDYLQVFDINQDIMVRSQEEPAGFQMYKLKFLNQLETKIFAIREADVWTILYPEEY